MKIRNFRWWIIVLIALATAINYLDRQNLPVAVSEIRKSIPLSDGEYGIINSLFLLAYGTMYAVGGRLLDILGTRAGYTVMIVWWSLANVLHGLVSSVMGLGIARFLLGIGEGGGFPGSAKAVSEWFPARERSFAFGIFNTGSSLGAVIAPPLIALIITTLNWRWAFIITGLLGLLWVIAWLRIYSLPAKSRFITDEEKAYLAASLKESDPGEDKNPGEDGYPGKNENLGGGGYPDKNRGLEAGRPGTDEAPGRIPWLSLFRYRKVWGLMTIKFLTDAGWFFFIFWLPKYLNDVRGLDIAGIGSYAWIPYAFAGGGSFIGGWLSSFLLKRNLSLDLSRKISLGIAAILLPASLLIADASLNMAILFFSMAMFGHQFWSTIVQTLAADMFPSKVVGSVSGLMGCIGTYGAMLFSLVIGFVIGEYSYTPAFIVAGLLHPLSFVLVFIIIKRIEPVTIKKY